jgi:hypothetical protein
VAQTRGYNDGEANGDYNLLALNNAEQIFIEIYALDLY